MIYQFSIIQLEKDEEKMYEIEVIEKCHHYTFFGIVDPKIGVGELSIACNKCQSLCFRSKTSRYHWHTPFKSDMSLK